MLFGYVRVFERFGVEDLGVEAQGLGSRVRGLRVLPEFQLESGVRKFRLKTLRLPQGSRRACLVVSSQGFGFRALRVWQ